MVLQDMILVSYFLILPTRNLKHKKKLYERMLTAEVTE